MSNTKCDVCLENEGVAMYKHLAPLISKHLGKKILQDIFSCKQCVQLLELWEDFSSQARTNLDITHPDITHTHPDTFQEPVLETRPTINTDVTVDDNAQAVMICCNEADELNTSQVSSQNDSDEIYKEPSQTIFSEYLLDTWSTNDASSLGLAEGEGLQDPLGVEIKPSTLPFSDLDEPPMSYLCSECEKKFLYAKSLRLHSSVKHPKKSMSKIEQATSVQNLLDDNKIAQRKNGIEENNRDLRTSKRCYVCPKCDISIKSKELMISHLLDVCCEIVDAKYTCVYCSQKFDTSRGLNFHIRKHLSDIFSLSCKNCDKKFSSIQSLEKHTKEEHRNFKQTASKDVNHNPKSNKIHKRKISENVSREIPYNTKVKENSSIVNKCSLCSYSCATKEILSDHIINYHPHATNFECKLCLRKFDTNRGLSYHMLYHKKTSGTSEDSKPKQWVCSICSHDFANKTLLKNHFNRFHMKTRSNASNCKFKCKYCGNRFQRIQALASHIKCRHCKTSISQNKTISGVLNKCSFPCDFCHEEFKSKPNLDIHMRSEHLISTNNMSIKTEKSSESHSTIVHNKTDVKNYLLRKNSLKLKYKKRTHGCHICQKSFLNLAALKSHLRCHSKVSTQSTSKLQTTLSSIFKCKICKNVFSSLKVLNLHIKLHHHRGKEIISDSKDKTTQKDGKKFSNFKLVCNVCNKTLCNQSSLNDHMRRMHKKANIPCKICNSLFFSKASLLKHVKTHLSKQQNMNQTVSNVKIETKTKDNSTEKVMSISFCPYCKSKVRSSVLPQHIKVLHNEHFNEHNTTNTKNVESFEKYYKYRDSLYFCNFCLKSENCVSRIVNHVKKYHL